MARSCDLIMIVVDAASGKAERQRELLERELEVVGLRLNQRPPNVYFKRKKDGAVSISSTCQLVNITETDVKQLLHEYKIHSAEVLFREDCTIDQFIDILEGNRKYVRALYVYNKIDMTSIEECERVCSMPNTLVLSPRMKLNLDIFKDVLWEHLGLVRVYTKPRGKKPDFEDPLVLTDGRHGTTVEACCKQVRRSPQHTPSLSPFWSRPLLLALSLTVTRPPPSGAPLASRLVRVRNGLGHERQARAAACRPQPRAARRGRHPDREEEGQPARAGPEQPKG